MEESIPVFWWPPVEVSPIMVAARAEEKGSENHPVDVSAGESANGFVVAGTGFVIVNVGVPAEGS